MPPPLREKEYYDIHYTIFHIRVLKALGYYKSNETYNIESHPYIAFNATHPCVFRGGKGTTNLNLVSFSEFLRQVRG